MTKAESERQYAVVDQSLTMHALFRDHMEQRAFWLNTALIASSLFLTVFAFVGDTLLSAVGLDPGRVRFVLGMTAVVVLLFSITEFRVDWRSKAERHAEAVTRLAALKARYRKCFSETGGEDARRNGRMTGEYNRLMVSLPPIPDSWFVRLKAEHKFKRILSERISQYPHAPTWFLRTQLRLQGIQEARRGREDT